MEFPRIENFIHILVFFLSITTEASHKLSWYFSRRLTLCGRPNFHSGTFSKGFLNNWYRGLSIKLVEKSQVPHPRVDVEKSSSIFYPHFRIDELENLEILREKNALLSTIINHLSMWYHKNNKESKYNFQCSGMPFRSNYETIFKNLLNHDFLKSFSEWPCLAEHGLCWISLYTNQKKKKKN